MIRNDEEYFEAKGRVREEELRLVDYKMDMKAMGLNEAQVAKAIEPTQSFFLQLREEVEYYERLKQGDFGEITNLRGLGRMLVAMRIARGLSQTELANLLDVHVSQVNRDERNEYHTVSVERASKIMDILRADFRSKGALLRA